MDKKKNQLGINPSTANGRLVKDLLFNFIIKSGHVCYRCGGNLTRETFSIEHITPWLDDENPIELFFDLENIGYSHLSCNIGAARRVLSKHGTRRCYQNGCRCKSCTSANTEYARNIYTKEARHNKYKRLDV
jgi:hypothetical protein